MTGASQPIGRGLALLLAGTTLMLHAAASAQDQGPCAAVEVGYWQHRVASPEARLGVWPGVSARLAEAILRERKLKFEKHREAGAYFDTALIVTDPDGETSILQVRNGIVESIFEYVGATLDGRSAKAALADYRSYLCWRFGSVSRRSNLEPRDRAEILGPIRVYDLASGADANIAIDVFRVEDPARGAEQQLGIVFSIPRQ